MKKYYIKDFFSDWQEVDKEKYERYKELLFKGITTGEQGRKYVEENYLKVVEE